MEDLIRRISLRPARYIQQNVQLHPLVFLGKPSPVYPNTALALNLKPGDAVYIRAALLDADGKPGPNFDIFAQGAEGDWLADTPAEGLPPLMANGKVVFGLTYDVDYIEDDAVKSAYSHWGILLTAIPDADANAPAAILQVDKTL